MRYEALSPLLKGGNYTPEQIDILQLALDDAWLRALVQKPFLALLGANGGHTREMFARAILEAAADGCLNLDELTKTALKCLPELRRRGGA